MKYRHIDTIDFASCEVLRKEKLFYDSFNKKYYKIWKENTKVWERDLGNTFLLALNCGFYEDISNIDSLIISKNGSCLGYITNSMRCLKETDSDIAFIKNKHKLNSLQPAETQNDKYKKFYNKIIENTKKTEIFFYDLVQLNIADLGDKYVLIDYESVLHIRNLYKIPVYHRDCMPVDYYAFLRSYYNEVVNFKNSGINMDLIGKAWSMSTGGMNLKPYYSVNINGEDFNGERPWSLRWPKIKGAMNWSNKKILDLGTCMAMVPVYLLKYCEAASATAIDFNQYLLDASDLVRQAFQIPKDKIKFINIDIDNSDYENILGYEYDAVFCLSFLRWIKNQDRLMNYLSKFKNIFIEPHDLDGDIINRFKDKGFINYKLLGDSRIGISFPEKRKMYYFWK